MKNTVHKKILQFETLMQYESLFAFSTTISGGVSKGNYSSFNLGLYSGDDADCVRQNREQLKTIANVSELYLPYQNHGDQIRIINSAFLALGEEEKLAQLDGVDALITQEKNICIGVTTADCVPILIYDPVQKVLATVHAGWRGTVARLPEKTILAMNQYFGCDPQDLIVGIAPSISAKCFEVGDEVIDHFVEADFFIDNIAYKNSITNKYHIDLWQANKEAISRVGVVSENIEVSALCTFSNSETFFSARRQSIYSGRMVTGGVILG